MKIDYRPGALDDLERMPADLRRQFSLKVKFLEQNLRHPSLHAKKYDEANNIWQARISKGWRFYFVIVRDAYII